MSLATHQRTWRIHGVFFFNFDLTSVKDPFESWVRWTLTTRYWRCQGSAHWIGVKLPLPRMGSGNYSVDVINVDLHSILHCCYCWPRLTSFWGNFRVHRVIPTKGPVLGKLGSFRRGRTKPGKNTETQQKFLPSAYNFNQRVQKSKKTIQLSQF